MNKKGFSLAEAMVACLLIALTTGLVLHVFTADMGTVEMTGRRVEALSLSAQSLEHLRNEVAAATWPGGSLAAGNHAGEGFLDLSETHLGDMYNGARTYTVTDNPNGIDEYKLITVTVGWTEP
ncbi:hypothetical protein ACFL2I_00120 [Candidatus Omnitrophota bacterium]